MKDLVYIPCPSPNYDARHGAIKYIIIHSTECPSTEAALSILTSPERKVSCHYLISKSGDIYRLVEDEKRAWHAGESAWDSDTDLNHSSIGIELDHPSPDEGCVEYPKDQIDSLNALLKELVHRHGIKTHNIIGHSDIAPHRKRDPGNDFPWEKLAEKGLGCWTLFIETKENINIDQLNAQRFLHDIGYRMGNIKDQIIAFQRHFLRHNVNGELDSETYRNLTHIAAEMKKNRDGST